MVSYLDLINLIFIITKVYTFYEQGEKKAFVLANDTLLISFSFIFIHKGVMRRLTGYVAITMN